MAFLIDATMKGYRVLGIRTFHSKKGTEGRSIDVYKDGRNAEISCTDANLIPYVDGLQQMDIVNLDVVAVSGKERSYIMLVNSPVLVDRQA